MPNCNCNNVEVVRPVYIVLFKGDDSNFTGNQTISVTISTQLDLTGCKAHFRFMDFVQDFNEIPADKTLELVFPANKTAAFPLGTANAILTLEDSVGRTRTVDNRIHVLVTNSVPEAYSNHDTQAVTVTVAGVVTWDMIQDKPTIPSVDDHLSTVSENPVQNKVITEALNARPTKAQMDEGWWSDWACDIGWEPGDGLYDASYSEGVWTLRFKYYGGDNSVQISGTEDATSLSFSYDGCDYTATRHRVAAPVPTKPADIGAQPSLGFTPENSANKVTSLSPQSTDAQYPSAKCVASELAGKRGVTDLGVRGAPQGEGSWFVVNGNDTEYSNGQWEPQDYSFVIVRLGENSYRISSDYGNTTFSLDAEFSAKIDITSGFGTIHYSVIGYVDTLANQAWVQNYAVANDGGVAKAKALTQEQYEAISTPDANTLYVITED